MHSSWKYQKAYDKLALILISLFALECAIGGSGRWLELGPVSIRMLLFGVCFVVTLPNVFRHFKEIFRRSNIIAALLLGVYLVLSAVIGLKNGNSRSFVWADISSFLTLALMPGFLATVRNGKQLQIVTDIVYYGSLFLAIVTVFIHFLLAFTGENVLNAINTWLNDHSIGGMASLRTGLQRIYMRSQLFLQVGLLLGLWKIWQKNGCIRWLLLVCEGIIAFACLISYTRGFWLGFTISAVLLLVLEPSFWKRYVNTLSVTAGLLVLTFGLSWAAYRAPVAGIELINRFDPDIVASLGHAGIHLPINSTSPNENPDKENPLINNDVIDADKEAVEYRQKALQWHKEMIAERPLLGSGLGTNFDGVREDGKTEYTYLDMLMKLGIVGFVLFAGAFFLPFIQLGKRRILRLKGKTVCSWNGSEVRNSVLMAAYFGLVVTSWVNPFLINPMGIMLLMLLTAAVCCSPE